MVVTEKHDSKAHFLSTVTDDGIGISVRKMQSKKVYFSIVVSDSSNAIVWKAESPRASVSLVLECAALGSTFHLLSIFTLLSFSITIPLTKQL